MCGHAQMTEVELDREMWLQFTISFQPKTMSNFEQINPQINVLIISQSSFLEKSIQTRNQRKFQFPVSEF